MLLDTLTEMFVLVRGERETVAFAHVFWGAAACLRTMHVPTYARAARLFAAVAAAWPLDDPSGARAWDPPSARKRCTSPALDRVNARHLAALEEALTRSRAAVDDLARAFRDEHASGRAQVLLWWEERWSGTAAQPARASKKCAYMG